MNRDNIKRHQLDRLRKLGTQKTVMLKHRMSKRWTLWKSDKYYERYNNIQDGLTLAIQLMRLGI